MLEAALYDLIGHSWSGVTYKERQIIIPEEMWSIYMCMNYDCLYCLSLEL